MHPCKLLYCVSSLKYCVCSLESSLNVLSEEHIRRILRARVNGKARLVSKAHKQKRSRCLNRKLLSWDGENCIFPKVTNMGSMFGHRIDYNRKGVL